MSTNSILNNDGHSELLKVLERECKGDKVRYIELFSRVFKSNPDETQLEPRDSFVQWYKKEYGKELNFDELTGRKFYNAIVKFSETFHPTYQSTEVAVNDNKSALFGYTSPLARKKGITWVSTVIYRRYLNTERKEGDISNILRNIASDVITDIAEETANLIAGDNDDLYYEIIDNLGENCGEYIDKLISENKFTPAILNRLAIYRELTTTIKNEETGLSPQNEIVDEIYNHKLISSLKLSKYDSFADLVAANNNSMDSVEHSDNPNSGEDIDGTEHSEDMPTDRTIHDLNLHHGELDDFKKHVTERIDRLLNTCTKLNSTNPEDVYINPEIGFPEYIDATELKSVLFSYVDRTDCKSMLDSVRAIATTFPEYAGLITLVNALSDNQDLLFEFYTNFGKHIVSKEQTILQDAEMSCRISNAGANRLSSLRTQFVNDFISSSNQVDLVDLKETFDKFCALAGNNKTPAIVLYTSENKGITKQDKKPIEAMYNMLHTLFPSITHASVINFVCANDRFSSNR